MKKNYATIAATMITAAFLFSACSTPMQQPVSSQSYPATPYPSATYPAAGPSYSSNYGVVDSIQMVNTSSNTGGIGAGAVVGGVVGGLLGNQVGGGNGRTAATVAGTVGGALVGNQIEQRNKAPSTAYQIGIRLDNGSYQTITQETAADLRVGNRVRIENGRAYRY